MKPMTGVLVGRHERHGDPHEDGHEQDDPALL
jgi:hypothetical protein